MPGSKKPTGPGTGMILPECHVDLTIHNFTPYYFDSVEPHTFILQGVQDRAPNHVEPNALAVAAGSFRSEERGTRGSLTAIKAASIYQSPDPDVLLVLFVKVPFYGRNVVKV